MKSFIAFAPTAKRPKRRDQILVMMGGNESLMARVEKAESDYLLFKGPLVAKRESDSQIESDLQDLAAALKTLRNLYNPGGSARAIFEGWAAKFAGADIAAQLRDTMSDRQGEALVLAANAAVEDFQPRKHRPPDPLKAERLRLVRNLADIAKDAGISVKRSGRDGTPSKIHELLECVFDRLKIVADPDGDIREILENHTGT